jgi:activator of 2-hydroxyglutaryl-CoA dehydratase
MALLKRVGLEEEITFVGGVARQKGMVKALEETVKKKVNVSDEPEMVGAIGAALLALKRLEKISAEQRALSAEQGPTQSSALIAQH